MHAAGDHGGGQMVRAGHDVGDDFGLGWIRDGRLEDADDRGGAGAEIASIERIVLPITDGSLLSKVVQNRYVSTTAPAAFGPSSCASSRRPRTGCRPITSKYEPPTTPARISRGSPRPTMREADRGEIAELADGLDARLQVLDFGNGERLVVDADAGRALADVDQAIFVAIDERAEEHAADDAEDGGVGADPERERENHGDGEAFGVGEGAEGYF